MFDTKKTPIDYLNDISNVFKSLPKTEEEIKETLGKVKNVLDAEGQNVVDMWKSYQKASTSHSVNDIMTANKKAQEVIGTVSFASFLLLPGSFFVLPVLIEFAKLYKIELVPASIKKEFNI